MIETIIPFAGFYYSIHDEFMDSEVGPERSESVNWPAAQAEYARVYCRRFLKACGLEGEFLELRRPREYNFATDRIFARITEDAFRSAFRRVDPEVFERVCANMFTSRRWVLLKL